MTYRCLTCPYMMYAVLVVGGLVLGNEDNAAHPRKRHSVFSCGHHVLVICVSKVMYLGKHPQNDHFP